MSFCPYVLITTHTKGNLFSLCVFRMENIGGVAESRGGLEDITERENFN